MDGRDNNVQFDASADEDGKDSTSSGSDVLVDAAFDPSEPVCNVVHHLSTHSPAEAVKLLHLFADSRPDFSPEEWKIIQQHLNAATDLLAREQRALSRSERKAARDKVKEDEQMDEDTELVIAASKEVEPWTCSACTFTNENENADRDSCAICLHEKSVSHTWTCLVCTFVNGGGDASCVMCNSDKPVSLEEAPAAATAAAVEEEPRRAEKKTAAAAAATNELCLQADAETGLLHTGSAPPASASPIEGHGEADAVIVRRGVRRPRSPGLLQIGSIKVTSKERQALNEEGLDVNMIQTQEQAEELEERIKARRRVEKWREKRAKESKETEWARQRRLELGPTSEGYDMDQFFKDNCEAKALGKQLRRREGDDMYEPSDVDCDSKGEEEEGGC